MPLRRSARTVAACALVIVLHLGLAGSIRPARAQSPNLLANPGFEMGSTPWQIESAEGTVASFTVDKDDAAEGRLSALVTIGSVADWGAQFGQGLDAGRKGHTYTFAALARGVSGPVTVRLEIERGDDPWDRAAQTEPVALAKDRWAELHVTFQVTRDYPEGWTAYISCDQPEARFRVDAFRLYEGDYLPYEQVAKEETTQAGVRVFDTGAPSAAPLTGEAFGRRDGWEEVAPGEAAHRFTGDAVVSNERLTLALRPGARGAELYASGPGSTRLRAVLAPLAGAQSGELTSATLIENSPDGAAVDATFRASNGSDLALRYRLTLGQVFVETEPQRNVTALGVEAPCRYVILPDFFADDIVVDATALPVSEADLPGENFLLHMLGAGEAVLMNVWSVGGEDVHVQLSEHGGPKSIDASEIQYGNEGKVWVAVIEGPGAWHERQVTEGDRGNVIPLDWRAPFPAQWQVDWTRDDGLIDSWAMLNENPGGNFTKPSLYSYPDRLGPDRRRWTTVLGWFEYPCWIDKAGQGHLEPLRRVVTFKGPAIIYPVNRVNDTPLDVYTVVDIVRSTLGVGPCEYILDLEAQRSTYQGQATCATRDLLDGIYGKGQQKERRADVEQALVDVMIFIRHIRGRIESYVEFGHEMLDYLAAQKEQHPELADRIAELETFTKAIDARVARRSEQIKTTDYAAGLVDQFRASVLDYEGPDALDRCKKLTEAWVDIGGNQDELAGECRWAVKMLRQRAALALAVDPRMAEIAKEIRERTQVVLRNPAGHEGARH